MGACNFRGVYFIIDKVVRKSIRFKTKFKDMYFQLIKLLQ